MVVDSKMTLEDLTDISIGDDRVPVNVDVPKKQKEQSYEMTPYNPFVSRPNQSWDDRAMERMLRIKRPPPQQQGEIWFDDPDFAETFSLLPLNKPEQGRIWRKVRKIQMQASGELNKKMVESRQQRLMVELVSQKSRLDVSPNGNLNEREMWVTTRQQLEQTLKTPAPSQPRGFFGTLIGGLTGK